MNMPNLIDDLSTLTTIPVTSLQRLADKSMYCICHDVEEALLNKDNTIYVNIGIGTLGVQVNDDTVLYKFIPSNDLEASIKSTVLTKKSPLENALELKLVEKITNAYKDLF